MGMLDKLKDLPTANEIKGSFGEQFVKYYAKTVTDTLILNDILIDSEDGKTTQLDVLMIGNKGIYVTEVKFYEDANIYGDGNSSKWYYYRGGKKYEIYSPLKQNKNHIKHLKNMLKDFGDLQFFSILVVLCRDFKVQNINKDVNKPDTVICSGILSVKNAMELLAENYPVTLDAEKKQQIYNYIVENQHSGTEARKIHKQTVKEIKEHNKSLQNQNLCPYCKTPLVLRKGKYGSFYGCSNYPKCRYTQKL